MLQPQTIGEAHAFEGEPRGFWGPGVVYDGILHVNFAYFDQSDSDGPPTFRPVVQVLVSGTWVDCDWLGTGGAAHEDGLRGWSQWSWPDDGVDVRMTLTDSRPVSGY